MELFCFYISGDPYGRPSSSLSPYKPLPSIGSVTPRDSDGGQGHRSPDKGHHHDPGVRGHQGRQNGDGVSVTSQRLSSATQDNYHPMDNNHDIFSAEDIHSYNEGHSVGGPVTDRGLPGVDILTNTPHDMTDQIYRTSLANYERNIETSDPDYGQDGYDDHEIKHGEHGGELRNAAENFEHLSVSAIKPLDFLHEIADEPRDGEERVLLAVKLPDGKRIQRYFRPTESLDTVIKFAENANLVKYEDFQLICNATHTKFTDLGMRICDTHIKDRTVLYLEEKD